MCQPMENGHQEIQNPFLNFHFKIGVIIHYYQATFLFSCSVILQLFFTDSEIIAHHNIKCLGHLKGEDERTWCQIGLYSVHR